MYSNISHSFPQTFMPYVEQRNQYRQDEPQVFPLRRQDYSNIS